MSCLHVLDLPIDFLLLLSFNILDPEKVWTQSPATTN